MVPERLIRLAKLAGPIKTGADIACDHAYLSYYLLKHNQANFMIATDIRANPLENAKRTLKPFRDRSELRLGFGLQPLTPGEVDTIFISGLGAETIVEILQEGMERFLNATFVLQVNGNPSPLRAFLMSKSIFTEDIVKENRHYYQIIVVKEGYKKGEQIWQGGVPILRIGSLYRSELGREYLSKRLGDIEEALSGLLPDDPRGKDLRAERSLFQELVNTKER